MLIECLEIRFPLSTYLDSTCTVISILLVIGIIATTFGMKPRLIFWSLLRPCVPVLSQSQHHPLKPIASTANCNTTDEMARSHIVIAPTITSAMPENAISFRTTIRKTPNYRESAKFTTDHVVRCFSVGHEPSIQVSTVKENITWEV